MVIDDYNEMIYLQTILKKIGFDVEGLNSTKKYADASLGFNPKVVIGSALGKKIDILQFGREIKKSRGLPKIVALKPNGREISRIDIEAAGIDLLIETPVNIKKLVLGLASLVGIDEAGFLEKLEKMAASKDDIENGVGDLMMLGSLDNLDGDLTERAAKKQLGEMLTLGEQENAPLEGEHSDIDLKLKNHGREDLANEGIVVGLDEADQVELEPWQDPAAKPKMRFNNAEVQVRRQRFEDFMKTMDKPEPSHFARDRILNFNKKIRSAMRPVDLDEVEGERKEFVKALFKKNKR